jgi:hypothetical protein
MVIDSSLRRQLLGPACFAFLIHCGGLHELEVSLADRIMQSWGIDDDDIDRLALRGYPSRIENLFAANECAKKFGGDDLATVEGFYKCRGLWWLDLDPKWCRNGFLMPVRDERHGWISSLLVFRDPKDRRPFRLG